MAKNKQIALCLIGITWVIFPVLSILLILLLSYHINFDRKYRKICYFLIAVSLALLAFTQVSTSSGTPTDIDRYYDAAKNYIGVPLQYLLTEISFVEFSYFIFTICNMIVVNISGNVQYMSLFWIFIVYFLYFLAVENYISARGISFSRRQFWLLLVVSIFGFILFTQITETIKQAAATSVFFYGLSNILLGRKYKGAAFIVASIFIHASIVMLLPILLFRKMTVARATLVAIGAVILSQTNIMLLASLLLSGDYFSFVADRASGYAEDIEGFASSIRFVMLALTLLSMIFWCWFCCVRERGDKYLYIGVIYCLILLLNYPLGHNFVRYINMSYCIYAFMFIEVLHRKGLDQWCRLRSGYISLLVFAFILTNIQMTVGRTIGGGYTSSYMNNSPMEILFSTIPEYLNYKAY